jgi:DNA polymerase III epsilon subunit-like protein
MKTLFIDLETTGLDPEISQIVEIAIVDIADRCILSTRYNVDESLGSYRPIDKFDLSTIESILTSADLVVGHNIQFDAGFLSETSKRILGYDCFANVKYICKCRV